MEVPPIDLIGYRLEGEDVLSWLQGQITQDARTLRVGEVRAFAFTDPRARPKGWGRIGRSERAVWVTLDACSAPDWERTCVETVILEDVRVQRGEAWWTGASVSVVAVGGENWTLGSQMNSGAQSRMDARDWHQARLRECRPWFPVDCDGKALIPEYGSAFLAAHVAMNKGCYVGQEVIHRIHARGRVQRTWRVFSTSVAQLEASGVGTDLVGMELLGASQAVVGRVLSAWEFEGLTWITAFVRWGEDRVFLPSESGAVKFESAIIDVA